MTWPRMNATQPAYGSWIDTWWKSQAAAPGTFMCGVRVISGLVEKESGRWRFRTSATDPLIVDGIVSLNHGTKTRLRLRVWPEPIGRGPRSRHVLITAVEQMTSAELEISVPFDELYRFAITSV